MDIFIRTATDTDAPAITQLSHQLGYHPTPEQTSAYMHAFSASSNDIVYVATINDKVAGWIHCFYTIRLESGAFCEIGGLVVDEAHRGKGIGQKLIEQAVLWAEEKCCPKLKVRTNIVRTETHKFYAAAGFTEVKQQKIFERNLI